MPTTVTPPATQTQYDTAGLQLSFVLADLRLALMDQLDTMPDMGEPIDMSGMSSLTTRMPVIDGIGYAQRMTASVDEVTLNAADSYTLDYTSASVAQYDLAYTQSIQNQVISAPGVVMTLDQLKAMLPMNLIKTLRYLYCTTGGTISAVTVGSAAAALDADDMYDLAAQINLRLGAAALGIPTATLDPAQFNAVRAAFRSEPAFVQNLAAFQKIQGVQNGQRYGDILGLGFDIQVTDDVAQSGGDYLGFCVSPGGIRRVKADPSRAQIPAAARPMFMPEYGVVVYETFGGLGSATLGWQAVGFLGSALTPASSSLQILVTSLV